MTGLADILLLTTLGEARAQEAARLIGPPARVEILRSAADCERAIKPGACLISFHTGVILTTDWLQRLARPAYNFHGAPPAYPGRDPHHFASYDRVSEYGATAHVITERVDAGPIVGVELFAVAENSLPADLLRQAEDASFQLLARLGPKMVATSMPLQPLPDVAWAPTKRSRRDFLNMCRLPLDIDGDEFERRLRAFDGGAYDNLTIEFHGRVFRIDKQSVPPGQNRGKDFS